MKMSWAIVALTVFTMSGVAGAANWLITEEGVGPVRVGMPIAQAMTALKGQAEVRTRTRQSEGNTETVYEVQLGGKSVMVVEPDADLVWRITVTDAQLRTQQGYGVGSTLAELRKTLPRQPIVPGAEGGGCLIAIAKATEAGYSLCFASPTPKPTDRVTKMLILGRNAQ